MCVSFYMVFHVEFSTENKHPSITEFLLFFNIHCPLREYVMRLIIGLYTYLMSNHATIYFHLFLMEWQLQQERENFRAFSLKIGYLSRERFKKLI